MGATFSPGILGQHNSQLVTIYTKTVQRWLYGPPGVKRDAYGNPDDTFGGIGGGDCWDDCNGLGVPGQQDYKITSVVRADGLPDDCGDPPPLEWKDWPQDKRNKAFELIAPSDWDGLFKSVPKSGELPPGVTINAPKTGIYGPDGKLRVLPGPYTNSGKPLKDSDIYKKLNPKQQQKLDKLLQRKNKQGENVYDEASLKMAN